MTRNRLTTLIAILCLLLAAGLRPAPARADSPRPPAASAQETAGGGLDDDELDALYEEAEEGAVQVSDPLEPVNRVFFHFNDKLYFWVLKPAAKGYRAVIPGEIRVCASNVFRNLAAPIRIINSLLQGKGKVAGRQFAGFFLNTVVGLGGLADIAARYPGLEVPEEDLGQTLGVYGIGNGPYLVLPFFGPSTLRDTVGLVGDLFLYPVTYIEPTEASIGVSAYETVNTTSFRIGDYEALKKATLDPYAAFRDGYIQRRARKIEQ